MDKINVLIVEDNPSDSSALTKVLEENNYNVIGIATSQEQAYVQFFKNPIDVVIIDVFLGANPDGISIAETINSSPHSAKPFVFLTGSKDRQIFERAKLTHPFSYLLKPFNKLELLYAIEMAIERFYAQPNVFVSDDQDTVISDNYLFIKKKNSLKKVLISEIIYIKVEDRYCNIVTEKEKFLILISLTKINELLDSAKFVKTHRNYVINLQKVKEIIIQENLILLEGGHNVTLSDNYKNIINTFHILK